MARTAAFRKSANSLLVHPGEIKPNLSNLRCETYGMPLEAVALIWGESRFADRKKTDAVREKMIKAQPAWGDADLEPHDWDALTWLDNSNLFLGPEMFKSELSAEYTEFILDNLGDENEKSSMAWLVNQIKTHGFNTVTTGRVLDGKGVIASDGNRRWTAVRILALMGVQIEFMRVDAEPDNLSLIDIAKRQFANNTSNHASALEEAVLFGQLIDSRMEPAEIARSLGITLHYVMDKLKLRNVSHEVHQLIRGTHPSGMTIAPTTVIDTVRQVKQSELDSLKAAEIATEIILEAAEAKAEQQRPGKMGSKVVEADVIETLSRNPGYLSEDTTARDDTIRNINSLLSYADSYSLATLKQVEKTLSRARGISK